MLRILAVLAFVAALSLGQSGRGPSEAAPVPGDGLLASALGNIWTHGAAQHDKTTCPPSDACCYSSCSPTVALVRSNAPIRSGDCSTIGLQLSECSLRSVLLKRDPPIPRPLV